jgi:surface protein
MIIYDKKQKEKEKDKISNQSTTIVNTIKNDAKKKNLNNSFNKGWPGCLFMKAEYINEGNRKIVSDEFFNKYKKYCNFIINSKLSKINYFEPNNTKTTISIKLFLTESISDFESMFEGCSSLKAVKEFKCIYAKSTRKMFKDCISLEIISNDFEFLFDESIENYISENNNSLNDIYDCNTTDFKEYSDIDKFHNLYNDEYSYSFFSSIYENNNSLTLDYLLKLNNNLSSYIHEDISYMFSGCRALTRLPDISKWDTSNVNNMSYLFFGCSRLIFLPDISKWDMSNVSNIRSMFAHCLSLSNLPDISGWRTDNITDMSELFMYCSSLSSLPNISKWNTSEVQDIHYMFGGCSQLKCVPDISKWKTDNIIHMNHLFTQCTSLITMPNISEWNTTNVTDMSFMFYNCSSLKTLPDISKWNTIKVIDMSFMFFNCSSLVSLPNISKWKTKNVKYMNHMNHMYHMNHMFNGCSNLIFIPDIFQWPINQVYDMRYIFANCSSLNSLPDLSKLIKDLKKEFSGINNQKTNINSQTAKEDEVIFSPSCINNRIKFFMKGAFDNCLSLINKPSFDNIINSNNEEIIRSNSFCDSSEHHFSESNERSDSYGTLFNYNRDDYINQIYEDIMMINEDN